MEKIFLILAMCIPFFSYSENWIEKKGENVTITSSLDSKHKIEYLFKRCMANNIYTFYTVSIINEYGGKSIANRAISDNIGPFEIKNGGWCGGNHLYKDNFTPTAETFDIKIIADDKCLHNDTSLNADRIIIKVANHIYNPQSAYLKGKDYLFNDTLCIENVNYLIDGNSIEVEVEHSYINKIPVEVSKYYGLQSMFVEEKFILTPLGKYDCWTKIENINRFKKKDFPKFNQFIEKNDSCFQSTYLLKEGLGSHKDVDNADVVFIGNSWSKSYHKLIGDKQRIAGENDSWKGVYTWGLLPLIDTNGIFAYTGRLKSKDVWFINILKKGEYMINLPENLKNKKIRIIEKSDNIIIKNQKNFIYFRTSKPVSSIITFDN